MSYFIWALLILFTFYVPQSQAQSTPVIQGNSPHIQMGRRVITMPTSITLNTQNFGVLLNRLTIPTENHKKPFVSLSSTSSFTSQADKSYYMLADIVIVSQTMFNIRLDLVKTTSGIISWSPGSTIKFDYMLIAGTFPSIYISNKLDVIKGVVQTYPKINGRKDYHLLNDWVGTAPFSLTSSGVRFVWAILCIQTESLSNDNKFAASVSISANSATQFMTTLNTDASYNIKIKQFKISLFIYDKTAFDNTKLSLRNALQIVPPFAPGPNLQHFVVNGWINYPGMPTLTGLAGFHFTTTNYFAVQSRISLITYTVDIHLYVQNLAPSMAIPQLRIVFLTVSQPTCPSNMPLLDSNTQNQCLTTCPANQKPSINPFGITGLYACTACAAGTCCSNGFTWNGTACQNCPLNCAICGSLNSCVTCDSGYIKDSNGVCVQTPSCSPPCTLCSGFTCLTCAFPFQVGGGACICPAGTTLVSGSCDSCLLTLSNCNYCTSPTICTQCNQGFYVNGTNGCSSCSPGCLVCTSSTVCSQCLSFLTQNAVTSQCECGAGFYFNTGSQTCVPCINPYCLQCSSATVCSSCDTPTTLSGGQCYCPVGQVLYLGSCKPCNAKYTNCLACDSATCLTCDAKYFKNTSGQCQSCSLPCSSCDSLKCTGCEATFSLVTGNCICSSGYYLNSGLNKCDSCNVINNCINCLSAAECTSCDTGYFVSPSTKSCDLCPLNCQQCDPTGCTLCNPNYAVVNNPNSGPSKICDFCSSVYGSLCTACDSIKCTKCTAPSIPSSTGFCQCLSGFIMSGGLCELCSSKINNCQICSSISVCTLCMTGFYSSNPNSCLPCNSGCTACTAATVCTQCQTSLILNGGQCLCSTGFYFDGALNCLPCNTPLMGCLQCLSSSQCILCSPSYYLPTGMNTCVSCTSNCLNCDQFGCLICQNGFFKFIDVSNSKNICKDCKIQYGNQCLSCDSSQCINCATGYFWLPSSNQCVSMDYIVCNDGIWVEQFQACDDGNSVNGDGCNSNCQIETDYECLLSDKQPSGASFCRFTKDLTLLFDTLQKQSSANVVNLFLNVEPSTFMQLTQQSIKKLLKTIQIINKDAGAVKIIPLNSIQLSFKRKDQKNQIHVAIDYGLNNLQGSFLRFNIDSASTSIPSLKFSPIQNDIFLPIDTTQTAVYLYGYSQDVYQTQRVVQNISKVIGFFSLLMAFVGFCVPGGKIVIIQALAVVQISYFSVLQYQKIPPTFIGLKNLIFSNGYNEQTLFAQKIGEPQNIYNLIGLRVDILSNYNISLIFFLIIPALFGGIGLVLTKLNSKSHTKSNPDQLDSKEKKQEQKIQDVGIKNKETQTQEKNELNQSKGALIDNYDSSRKEDPQNLSSKDGTLNRNIQKKMDQTKVEKISFIQFVFERILNENTFYGVFLTSYLAWISTFYSFSNFKTSNIAIILVHIVFLIFYGVIFLLSVPQKVTLHQLFGKSQLQQQSDKVSLRLQNLKVLRRFGQFSQIFIQNVQNIRDPSLKIYSKLAIILLIQRLISSICIVFIGSSISLVSGFIILIYICLYGILIWLKRKLAVIELERKKQISRISEKEDGNQRQNQTKEAQAQPKIIDSVKSSYSLAFFYQNYFLRQGLNFLTIICIQVLYLIANIKIKTSDPYEIFMKDSIIIKDIPIAVLSLLALNLILNTCWWLVELKYDLLMPKFKTILSNYFQKNSFYKYTTNETSKPFPQNNEMNQEPQIKQKQSKPDQKEQASRFNNEEEEVVNMLKQYLSTSPYLRTKQSPFIGIREKQAEKQASNGLFTIQEVQKVQMSAAAKQLRSKLITDVWDQI